MTRSATSARDQILASLRRSLANRKSLFRGDPSGSVAPDVPMTVTQASGDGVSLAALFGAKLEEVLGSYEIVERTTEVSERVVRWIERWNRDQKLGSGAPARGSKVSEVLSWAANELPVPDLEGDLQAAGISLLVPDDLHDKDCRARASVPTVGLTGVDAAFASTGSVMLASEPGKSRVASLLPLNHLMLVPISRIYPTFELWLRQLRGEERLEAFLRQNGQIAFITGPSKSADIELNLTLGVHGPGVVHAVVFDDTQ